MTEPVLRVLTPDQAVPRRRAAVDEETLAQAAVIVADVRREGEPALRRSQVTVDRCRGPRKIYGPKSGYRQYPA